MENYDSEESKKHSKKMDEIYKKATLTDDEVEKIKKLSEEIAQYLIVYNAKYKDGTLTEEEKKEMAEALPRIVDLLIRVNDFILVLDHKLFHGAEKLMGGIKKAGEAGNKEAEKAYKDLFKTWLEIGTKDRGAN